MRTRDIVVTESDRARLNELLALVGRNPRHGLGDIPSLRRELDRAQVVADDEIADDVIKLNSQAVLVDLDTGERMQFTLVLPGESNIDEGRISVFAPMGTAMLGYRVGDKFEWPVPYGLRRMEVAAVSHDAESVLSAA